MVCPPGHGHVVAPVGLGIWQRRASGEIRQAVLKTERALAVGSWNRLRIYATEWDARVAARGKSAARE